MEREPAPGRKRWSVYRTPKSGPSGEPSDPPSAKPPPPTRVSATPTLRQTSGVGKAVLVLLGVVVLGVVGITGVVIASLAGDDGGPFGKSKVQVLTEDGVEDLVAALEEETGSTEVFSATIYPTYAVLRVPADRTSQREVGYYWDGHDFEPWGSKGTSSNARIDLAEIDAAILPPLVREARAQVDDPNTWYVIIDRDSSDDGWISAYASNEFSEGGYIEVDKDGKEIRRVGWPTEP